MFPPKSTVCLIVAVFVLRVRAFSHRPATKFSAHVAQMVGVPHAGVDMPPSGSYYHTQSTIPWQTSQHVYETPKRRCHSGYSPSIGTPVKSANAYNNQMQPPAQHRQGGVEGTTGNRMFRPFQTATHGAHPNTQHGYSHAREHYNSSQFNRTQHGSPTSRPGSYCVPEEHGDPNVVSGALPPLEQGRGPFSRGTHAVPGAHPNTQPGYSHAREHYNPQQFNGTQHGSPTSRPGSYYVHEEHSEGQAVSGAILPLEQGRGRFPRQGGRPDTSEDMRVETPSPIPPSLTRRANQSSSSGRTSSGAGSSRGQHSSLKEPTPRIHHNNSPNLLRTNSSKSSPPYILSRRKKRRVEEKAYLKEVKRSIAEGRVPQVRLQQNNNGDIIQYKTQFLNALKLAALSHVPNADIDVKNQSTMQEIMAEVSRQFIIDKPLPEGFVAGFLQRLYKRNRAVYHRHWMVHGDQSKPDDCTPAAWLQLIDYWKSREGSKECERNKANASLKKGGAIRYPTPPQLCANFVLIV